MRSDDLKVIARKEGGQIKTYIQGRMRIIQKMEREFKS